jgi:hypothetical protein
MRLKTVMPAKRYGQPLAPMRRFPMPEPTKGSDTQRTIALRVSPDYHAQLAMVAQIDEITLTDLMQRALDNYMAERRAAPDFQAKAQAALAEAEAQMARTRSMLLGALSTEGTPAESTADVPATSRKRNTGEASG